MIKLSTRKVFDKNTSSSSTLLVKSDAFIRHPFLVHPTPWACFENKMHAVDCCVSPSGPPSELVSCCHSKRDPCRYQVCQDEERVPTTDSLVRRLARSISLALLNSSASRLVVRAWGQTTGSRVSRVLLGPGKLGYGVIQTSAGEACIRKMIDKAILIEPEV